MENKKTINIPKTINDPYYRYKRNALHVKTNGGTILANLEIVAKDLFREAKDLLKYFGIESATHSFEKNNQYRLKGTFTTEKLEKLLENYIENYVLCKECTRPDTFLCSDNKKNLYLACTACGAHKKLDNLNKFGEYLSKNCKKIDNIKNRKQIK
jgi:translation initiation factor 5